jgi:methionyl-tRNA synthetase
MIERFSNGVIPQAETCQNLNDKTGEVVARAHVHLDRLEFGKALEAIWELVQSTNQYIDKTAPWKLAKQPDAGERLNGVLFHLAAVLKTLGITLYPFMPGKSEEILRQIGLTWNPRTYFPSAALNWSDLPGQTINKGNSLFPKIGPQPQGAKPVNQDAPATPSPAPAPAAAPAQITLEDFQKIQLRVAKVLSAERVPKSEKLIKLQVDLGTEQRQVVAGIGKKYTPEELVGRRIVIVANLKPAKLMGVESQGMVLAAGDAEVKELVCLMSDVDPGTKVK